MKRKQPQETRGRRFQPKSEGSRGERKPVNVEHCRQGEGQEARSERRQEPGHAGQRHSREMENYQTILNQEETSCDYFFKDHLGHRVDRAWSRWPEWKRRGQFGGFALVQIRHSEG